MSAEEITRSLLAAGISSEQKLRIAKELLTQHQEDLFFPRKLLFLLEWTFSAILNLSKKPLLQDDEKAHLKYLWGFALDLLRSDESSKIVAEIFKIPPHFLLSTALQLPDLDSVLLNLLSRFYFIAFEKGFLIMNIEQHSLIILEMLKLFLRFREGEDFPKEPTEMLVHALAKTIDAFKISNNKKKIFSLTCEKLLSDMLAILNTKQQVEICQKLEELIKIALFNYDQIEEFSTSSLGSIASSISNKAENRSYQVQLLERITTALNHPSLNIHLVNSLHILGILYVQQYKSRPRASSTKVKFELELKAQYIFVEWLLRSLFNNSTIEKTVLLKQQSLLLKTLYDYNLYQPTSKEELKINQVELIEKICQENLLPLLKAPFVDDDASSEAISLALNVLLKLDYGFVEKIIDPVLNYLINANATNPKIVQTFLELVRVFSKARKLHEFLLKVSSCLRSENIPNKQKYQSVFLTEESLGVISLECLNLVEDQASLLLGQLFRELNIMPNEPVLELTCVVLSSSRQFSGFQDWCQERFDQFILPHINRSLNLKKISKEHYYPVLRLFTHMNHCLTPENNILMQKFLAESNSVTLFKIETTSYRVRILLTVLLFQCIISTSADESLSIREILEANLESVLKQLSNSRGAASTWNMRVFTLETDEQYTDALWKIFFQWLPVVVKHAKSAQMEQYLKVTVERELNLANPNYRIFDNPVLHDLYGPLVKVLDQSIFDNLGPYNTNKPLAEILKEVERNRQVISGLDYIMHCFNALLRLPFELEKSVLNNLMQHLIIVNNVILKCDEFTPEQRTIYLPTIYRLMARICRLENQKKLFLKYCFYFEQSIASVLANVLTVKETFEMLQCFFCSAFKLNDFSFETILSVLEAGFLRAVSNGHNLEVYSSFLASLKASLSGGAVRPEVEEFLAFMVKSLMDVLKKALKKAKIDEINEDVWKFTTKLISIKEITEEEHQVLLLKIAQVFLHEQLPLNGGRILYTLQVLSINHGSVSGNLSKVLKIAVEAKGIEKAVVMDFFKSLSDERLEGVLVTGMDFTRMDHHGLLCMLNYIHEINLNRNKSGFGKQTSIVISRIASNVLSSSGCIVVLKEVLTLFTAILQKTGNINTVRMILSAIHILQDNPNNFKKEQDGNEFFCLLCKLLETATRFQRDQLVEALPLMLASLRPMLHGFLEPRLCTPKQLTEFYQAHPFPLISKHTLSTSSARQYSRLLECFGRSSASMMQGFSSTKSKRKRNERTQPFEQAVKKHLPRLLLEWAHVECDQVASIGSEVQEALEWGLYSMIALADEHLLESLLNRVDKSQREKLRGLHKNYQENYKYKVQ